MEYTGDVTAGGASDQRDLPLLTIRKASVGEMANNIYLLTCAHTGAQLLIDAADDPARILSLPSSSSDRIRAGSSAASTSSCAPVCAQVSR